MDSAARCVNSERVRKWKWKGAYRHRGGTTLSGLYFWSYSFSPG